MKMKILFASGYSGPTIEMLQFMVNAGHDVTPVIEVGTAQTKILTNQENPFDALVADVDLLRGSGVELLQYIARFNQPPTLVCSSIRAFSSQRNGKVEEFDLEEVIPKLFQFAQFHQKIPGENLNYVRVFLEKIAKS